MERASSRPGSVVVTGVSSGIGRGAARVLAASGYRVFGSVRKREDAERLSDELGSAFTPLLFDVTDERAVQAGAERVREALGGSSLGGLVNNAGIAVPGPLLEIPEAELRQQIEVNLVGAVTVTRAFLPLLRDARSPGRIVNISSPAGRLALPFLGAYAASKHALEGVSDGLRRELAIYGIRVVVIDPGTVATAIWDKADSVDLSPFAKSDYLQAMTRLRDFMVASGRKGAEPERIGRIILAALEARHPRLRYSAPTSSLFARLAAAGLLPKGLVDRALARLLGLARRAG